MRSASLKKAGQQHKQAQYLLFSVSHFTCKTNRTSKCYCADLRESAAYSKKARTANMGLTQ
jgi:hypothetical protein